VTRVTIYTDASIYRGVGSWATVIIREGLEPVEQSGKLRGRFESSTAVEGAAIANAVWYARRQGLLEPCDDLTVHCDNQQMVERLTASQAGRPWRDARDQVIMRACGYVLEAVSVFDAPVAFRWVKGHQRLDSRDPHALYNRRCDQLCGAARKGHKPPSWRQLQDQHAAFQRRREKREAAASGASA